MTQTFGHYTHLNSKNIYVSTDNGRLIVIKIQTGKIDKILKIDNSKVFILSTVKIKNIQNNMQLSYTLVAENEADIKSGKISVDSPIGKGLLGKKVGQVADITTPAGIMKFEIIAINR